MHCVGELIAILPRLFYKFAGSATLKNSSTGNIFLILYKNVVLLCFLN